MNWLYLSEKVIHFYIHPHLYSEFNVRHDNHELVQLVAYVTGHTLGLTRFSGESDLKEEELYVTQLSQADSHLVSFRLV